MVHSSLTVSFDEKDKKSLLTPAQRAFNRFNEKIKELQDQKETMIGDLDTLLLFYHEKTKPVENQLCALFTERVKIAYQYCNDSKKFSKIERGVFKEWILAEINRVESMVAFSELDSELKEIFNGITGADYDENAAAGIESIKTELAALCEGMGVQVDFSTIDFSGSREDIMQAFFRAFGKAAQKKRNSFEHEQSEKKKTKKQLEKEAKIRMQEVVQIQNMSTIYKRLVKVLHPDLEQDSSEKAKKEAFMKRVTTAYDNKNLFELLTVELEWMSSTAKSPLQQHLRTDEQIKIYNSILKDQIKELEVINGMVPTHARYAVLHPYYQDSYDTFVVKYNLNNVHKQLHELQLQMNEIRTERAIVFFKRIIKEREVMKALAV